MMAVIFEVLPAPGQQTAYLAAAAALRALLEQIDGFISIERFESLSEPGKLDQKGYRAGDKVGPFLIAKLSTEDITLSWEDKQFIKTIAELKPKEAPPAAQGASASGPPTPTKRGAALPRQPSSSLVSYTAKT